MFPAPLSVIMNKVHNRHFLLILLNGCSEVNIYSLITLIQFKVNNLTSLIFLAQFKVNNLISLIFLTQFKVNNLT